MCYFFIGLVIKIPAVSGLMESFVSMLKDKGEWWSNILLTIRVDIIAVVIIIRTKLEDDMLKENLLGYREYSEKVKYRLIPFVW